MIRLLCNKTTPRKAGGVNKPIDPVGNTFEGPSDRLIYSLPERNMRCLASLCIDVVCRFAARSADLEVRASETPHYRCLYSRPLLLPSSSLRLTSHAVLTDLSCQIARSRVLDRLKMQRMADQSPHLTPSTRCLPTSVSAHSSKQR
jgi:hypothetical protein